MKNSSSTAMEVNIIVEVSITLKTHNLIYNKIIADGDSSCYEKSWIPGPVDAAPLIKSSDTNHLLRNYSVN